MKKQKIAGAVGVLLILGIIGSAVEDDGRRGVPDAKDIEKDYKGTLYGSDEEITGSLLLDDETGAERNEGRHISMCLLKISIDIRNNIWVSTYALKVVPV